MAISCAIRWLRSHGRLRQLHRDHQSGAFEELVALSDKTCASHMCRPRCMWPDETCMHQISAREQAERSVMHTAVLTSWCSHQNRWSAATLLGHKLNWTCCEVAVRGIREPRCARNAMSASEQLQPRFVLCVLPPFCRIATGLKASMACNQQQLAHGTLAGWCIAGIGLADSAHKSAVPTPY